MTRSQAAIVATLKYIFEDGTVTIPLRNRASVVHDISISSFVEAGAVLLLRLIILSKLARDGLDVIHLSSISWI